VRAVTNPRHSTRLVSRCRSGSQDAERIDRFAGAARYTTLLQPGETTSRKEQWRANAKEYEKDNGWGCECTQGACLFCGLYADLPGTFTWHGHGVFEYLNGDTRDPPPEKGYYNCYNARRFRNVPRPPDGWKGLPLEKTNNGSELPKDAQATGSAAGSSVDGSADARADGSAAGSADAAPAAAGSSSAGSSSAGP